MPFQGESSLDVALHIASEPYPLATSLAPDLPVEVDELFARALARDREDRFQSAREMATAISAVSAIVSRVSEPPFSSPPSSRVSFEPLEGSAPASFRFTTSGPASSPSPSLFRPAPGSARPGALRALPGGGGRCDETLAEGSTFAPSSRGSSPPRRSGTMPRASAPRAVSTLIDEGFDALRVGDREAAERFWRAALKLDPDNRLLLLNLQKLAALGGKGLGVAERR